MVNKQHRITAVDGRSLLVLCILVAANLFTMICIPPPAPLPVDVPSTYLQPGRQQDTNLKPMCAAHASNNAASWDEI